MQADNGADRSTPLDDEIQRDSKGKRRIVAELKRLEKEAIFLEQEMEELDKNEKASAACEELVNSIESSADPLLPVTSGPANPSWDRWFEGPQESRSFVCCRFWIF